MSFSEKLNRKSNLKLGLILLNIYLNYVTFHNFFSKTDYMSLEKKYFFSNIYFDVYVKILN